MSAAANDSERGAKVFLTTLSILLAPVFLGLLVLCLRAERYRDAPPRAEARAQ